jgi:hypothetical protein
MENPIRHKESIKEQTDLPPHVLYSHYKILSRGVFDVLHGNHTKERLKDLEEQHYECARKRTMFMMTYVDPQNRDYGHVKVIDIALKKAFACNVAANSEATLKKWYAELCIIYNRIILDYNDSKYRKTVDYYYALTQCESVNVPRTLHISAIKYAIKMINLSRGAHMWYLNEFEPCKQTFWALCGMSEDPMVSQLSNCLWM